MDAHGIRIVKYKRSPGNIPISCWCFDGRRRNNIQASFLLTLVRNYEIYLNSMDYGETTHESSCYWFRG